MLLVDTHVHVVSPDLVRYPQSDAGLANGTWWRTGETDAASVEQTLAEAGVHGVVEVQAYGPYKSDNSYLADNLASSERPSPLTRVGVSAIDPDRDPASQLDGWTNGHRGTRLFHLPTPDPAWLDSPIGDSIVDAAAERSMAPVVCIESHDLARLAHVVARRPAVDILLDHCGFTDFRAGAEELRALAPFTNLHLKITPTFVDLCTDGDGAALMQDLVATFGADRLLWGSDYPQHRAMPYAEQLREIRSWVDGLDADEQAAILGLNAARIWPEFVDAEANAQG